jgi:hypothetical protein
MNETNAEALELLKQQVLEIFQAMPKKVQEQHPKIPQEIQEIQRLGEVWKPLQAVKQYLPPLKK